MDWNIFNSKLNNLVKSQTLLGQDKGEISVIGVSDSNCYLQKGKQVYKFEVNGNFFRSPKLENDPLDIYLKKALENKEYKIAIRIYYLKVLKSLQQQGKIYWKKYKTNRHYENEMLEQEDYAQFKETIAFKYKRLPK